MDERPDRIAASVRLATGDRLPAVAWLRESGDGDGELSVYEVGDEAGRALELDVDQVVGIEVEVLPARSKLVLSMRE